MPFRPDSIVAVEIATDVPPNERIEITSAGGANVINFYTGDPAENGNSFILVNINPDDHVTPNRRMGLVLRGPGYSAANTGHGTIEIDSPAADGSVPTEIYLLPHQGGATGTDWVVSRDPSANPNGIFGFQAVSSGKVQLRSTSSSSDAIDLSAPNGIVNVSSGGVGTGDLKTGRIDFGVGLVRLASFTFTLDGSGNATITGAFPSGHAPQLAGAFWFDAFGQHRPLTITALAGITGQVQVSSGGIAGSAGASGAGTVMYL